MPFCKIDAIGDFFVAPTAVYAPGFTLLAESHASYQYPVDGWYWFDSEGQAREVFGLPPAPPPPVETEEPQ
jgi:hypothetical protein